MVSINPVSVSALQNSLKLFKAQAPEATRTSALGPKADSSQAGSSSIIAKLAAQLLDIRKGGQSASDVPKPATDPAATKAKWQKFYADIETDTRENLASKVADWLMENGGTPELAAAMKNGTLKVQQGEEVGFTQPNSKLKPVFDSDGNYTGATSGAGNDWTTRDQYVGKGSDGGLYAKADGKHASYGTMNGVTFFATWP